MKQKLLSLLVLLMAAATGAWAQEQSETIATTASQVEGTHFTISNNDHLADEDGMIGNAGITVTSKNGEVISKVVITCTYGEDDVTNANTTVSSGTKKITNDGETITVTGVYATTFTFTCSNSGPQFGQFVVYYYPEGYTPPAATTYNVTFSANGNSKTIENVTLPHVFMCDYMNENGELDGIIKELYGLSDGYCEANSTPVASGNSNVTADLDDDYNQYINIDAAFSGTAQVKGKYRSYEGSYDNQQDVNYTLTISVTANESEPASNSCGDGLAWELNGDVLTISYDGEGTGAMNNWDEENPAPWFNDAPNIKYVEIADGVTSIGAYAFANCGFRFIDLPASVTTIGDNAFANIYMSGLTINSSECVLPQDFFDNAFMDYIYVPAEALGDYQEPFPYYEENFVAIPSVKQTDNVILWDTNLCMYILTGSPRNETQILNYHNSQGGITITSEVGSLYIDDEEGLVDGAINFGSYGGKLTFTSAVGNITRIDIQGSTYDSPEVTGWTWTPGVGGDNGTLSWTGDAATVEMPFDQSIIMEEVEISFTIGGDTPSGAYAVSLKAGTADATNWTIAPTSADEGATVTLTYAGTKKVKSVKVVKKAALLSVTVTDPYNYIDGKDKTIYYVEGETWEEAITNHTENADWYLIGGSFPTFTGADDNLSVYAGEALVHKTNKINATYAYFFDF